MVKVGLVLGIGVDIVKKSRFEHLLKDKSSSFAARLGKRILHPKHEHPRFQTMKPERQVEYMTGAWAAKEALFKTLNPTEQSVFNFNDWYRYHDSQGKPFVWNDDLEMSDEKFHLSISHDGSFVIATVLRQKTYNL
ncbi:uncharacterized protein LODBEIA_P06690 [Lodderomyces beijingensis]|uniref:4'-phosphopantetheinyl transferase domain-containing protein n=1 Tax=Lodderomyces beijingensis TaxID=1775926 RepID=A0ABP0ZE46_9ASCO